mmetsp:Transcript_6811/g.20713  ORF Transcript_6811/g.20713 Transcript_6811/m.20713 type:complete len:273 (-) Transcript_6811:134-952(-)
MHEAAIAWDTAEAASSRARVVRAMPQQAVEATLEVLVHVGGSAAELAAAGARMAEARAAARAAEARMIAARASAAVHATRYHEAAPAVAGQRPALGAHHHQAWDGFHAPPDTLAIPTCRSRLPSIASSKVARTLNALESSTTDKLAGRWPPRCVPQSPPRSVHLIRGQFAPSTTFLRQQLQYLSDQTTRHTALNDKQLMQSAHRNDVNVSPSSALLHQKIVEHQRRLSEQACRIEADRHAQLAAGANHLQASIAAAVDRFQRGNTVVQSNVR